MEDMHGGPSGPQFYVLSEESYQELKTLQMMLHLMAAIAYTEEDDKNGNSLLTMRREQIYCVFEDMSSQIGIALAGVGRENEIKVRSTMWQ
ncbi:hypothetical protein [Dyella sp. 2HG41-7]|uniref:XAC0095 family protein n=1 Tax=Dyella sp. 2HG41-7 TaxID=2883239 RepID=UPI001F299EF2|nr:hypothetical protein [Dyella sp. 2HG41-7]